MPKRVPPVPWNVGRRMVVDPGMPGGGAGRSAGSCPSTIRNDYGQKVPTSQLFEASGSRGGGEALQVMLGVPEGLADHREPAERVADLQLLRHAHAAVELDRFLAHVTTGV